MRSADAGNGADMRKRRTPWAIVHLLVGLLCLLTSVSVAASSTKVDELIPIVLFGKRVERLVTELEAARTSALPPDTDVPGAAQPADS